MVKGFRQIVSLTMLSRVLGFVRDLSCNYFFGATALSDAWWLAFKIPNLTRRIFGEGAASASFIPVYSQELKKGVKESQILANTVISVVFVILSILVLLGWFAMYGYSSLFETTSETRLVFSLTSIMLPYAIMICVVAMLAGVLNSHFHFAAPAAAPILLNVFIVAAVFVSGVAIGLEPKVQVFVVAFAVVLAGLAQVTLQIIPLVRLNFQLRPAWQVHSEGFKKIIFLMGPMILGLTVTQLNTLADDIIAWLFSASQDKGEFFTFMGNSIAYPLQRGSLTHLYFSQRFYQLPLGVFGISLATAIFPVLSRAAADNDFDKLCKTVGRGIKFSIFIALPATVGLIIVSRPLIIASLEHGGKFNATDTDKTVWTLFYYSLGLCGFFMQQILTRTFYSMQDSKTPARSAIIAVCFNVVLNLILIWFLGTGGLAASTAFCSYLQVIIMFVVLRRNFGKGIMNGFVSSFFKVLVSTVIMLTLSGIALKYMDRMGERFWQSVFKIAVLVPLSALIYYVSAKVFRIEMLGWLGEKQPKEMS